VIIDLLINLKKCIVINALVCSMCVFKNIEFVLLLPKTTPVMQITTTILVRLCLDHSTIKLGRISTTFNLISYFIFCIFNKRSSITWILLFIIIFIIFMSRSGGMMMMMMMMMTRVLYRKLYYIYIRNSY